MTDLKDLIALVEETKTLTIYMEFRKDGRRAGWARFNIDEKLGSLAIQSDWGDYQHIWGGGPSSWGEPTFLEFLCHGSYHYLTDKLHYGGRIRQVVDGDATLKAMRAIVLERRRIREIDQYEARGLWREAGDLVGNIDGQPYGDNVWAVLNSKSREFHTFFDEVHSMIETEEAPSLVFLRDQLLPCLITHLQGRSGATEHSSASSR